jgi:hypothetical protein
LRNVTGGGGYNNPHGVFVGTSGTLNVTGNVTGGGYNQNNITSGIVNNANATVNVIGNVYASLSGWGYGIWNKSTGIVNVTGNVYGVPSKAMALLRPWQ